jgi:hypothetical protein
MAAVKRPQHVQDHMTKVKDRVVNVENDHKILSLIEPLHLLVVFPEPVHPVLHSHSFFQILSLWSYL